MRMARARWTCRISRMASRDNDDDDGLFVVSLKRTPLLTVTPQLAQHPHTHTPFCAPRVKHPVAVVVAAAGAALPAAADAERADQQQRQCRAACRAANSHAGGRGRPRDRQYLDALAVAAAVADVAHAIASAGGDPCCCCCWCWCRFISLTRRMRIARRAPGLHP
jgi:hypothetical protein